MNKHLTLLLALNTLTCSAQTHFDLEKDLLQLDSVVAQSSLFDQQKEKQIADIKRTSNNDFSPQNQYQYNKQLFDEYLKFDPDSAELYIHRCKSICKRYDLKLQYISSCISEALLKTIMGNLWDAAMMIKEIGSIEQLSPVVQADMAVLMLEFNMRSYLNEFNTQQNKPITESWQYYSKYLDKSCWTYWYYKTMLTKRSPKAYLEQLYRATPKPSTKAAMLAVAISQDYMTDKNYNAYLHYLICSSVNDIKSGNHEASSLIYLISSPHIKLSLERSFNYIMLATENAKAYKDYRRSLDIVKMHATITKQYQEKIMRHNKVLFAIMTLLLLALVTIAFLMLNIVKKRKYKDLMLKKVEHMNASLQQMVEQEKDAQQKIQNVNQLLKNELAYHNQNFFNVYNLVTKYISDVQEFKKTVFNLITAGKYDKARKELSSSSAGDKYLKQFFEMFDKSFLLSHPDFISRFNTLLRPECHIQQPAPNTLTPELRIYALVSIGITDSVSIAQFLHYSVQTVYNYRLKIRHNSCIPEKDFADTVAKMYDNK